MSDAKTQEVTLTGEGWTITIGQPQRRGLLETTGVILDGYTSGDQRVKVELDHAELDRLRAAINSLPVDDVNAYYAVKAIGTIAADWTWSERRARHVSETIRELLDGIV